MGGQLFEEIWIEDKRVVYEAIRRVLNAASRE